MVHALSSLAEYAALRGVTITLEDFDGFLQPFARTYPLLWFMEHVPGLRYTLDIGNFAFSDEDVSYAAWLLKDYIVHVHCKDRAESPLVHGRFCRGLGQTPSGENFSKKIMSKKFFTIFGFFVSFPCFPWKTW